MPRLDEQAFEKHFCHQLELKGDYKGHLDSEVTVDKTLCLHFEMLELFLNETQKGKLKRLKEEFGVNWKNEIIKKVSDELKDKPLFELLKEGIVINNIDVDLVYFKPQTSNNINQQKMYEENVFSYIRQYHFGSAQNIRQQEDFRQSIDIVLCLNGFAIVTIELKNETTSGTAEDAVKQYLERDLSRPIFHLPFLHIVADNERVKMAASFSETPSEDDFRDFNEALVNVAPNDKEFPVHYLYHEILLPDSLLNYIESYLYRKDNGWIFPRYHQQRCVRKVFDDITAQYRQTGELNLRYLIQHSAGSGKSNTIVWLVQNLRNLHINNEKLFSSIVVLTHRINLDDQISKDFMRAIGQMGVVAYCKTADELRKALEKESSVIVTILHKFNYLKELADQTNKKICFIIDEAHTSQGGKLHEKMVDTFDEHGNRKIVKVEEEELIDEQESLIEEISRKYLPNIAFIALTATPGDKTLEHFGRKKEGDRWEAFDNYTMDEAIAEGYIMDVVKNVISYETLYELNYQYKSDNEYPPLQIYRALKLKAFEDDEVIKEKCRIITTIFMDRTENKINGKAKALVVTPSRLSAVKYKLFLDDELNRRHLPYKTIAAFTGSITYSGKTYTETEMNRINNPQNLKIEDCFHQDDNIRFLIVANKFQVGFDESLLHTMFLDKAVRDRNAVQTISRLNRIHPDKEDTLTVDFTNSYDEIIKGFRKFQGNVEGHKEADPEDLYRLKDELLKRGIFTNEDVEDCIRLFESPNTEDAAPLAALLSKLKGILNAKFDTDKKGEFRTLLARYVSLFKYINALFHIPQKALHDFAVFSSLFYQWIDPAMSKEELEREIEQVRLKAYNISLIDGVSTDEDNGGTGIVGQGRGGGSISTVRPMATVEEVIIAINLRFRESVSPEGVEVVEGYLHSLQQDAGLKTTIKNNLTQDEGQVYELVIKSIMDNLYTEYIINHLPQSYSELTHDNIKGFVNRSAYKMMREVMRTAA